MYTTWRKDILIPYIEYFGCIGIMVLVVMLSVGASWFCYVILFGVCAVISWLVYMRKCWFWMSIYKWGIEVHYGGRRIRLDWGTFDVVYVPLTASSSRFYLTDVTHESFGVFAVDNDFVGLEYFKRACRKNNIIFNSVED